MRYKPNDGHNPSSENKVLTVFERIGQVGCVFSVLCFNDTNPRGLEPWLAWLLAAALLTLLYECWWIRYFCGKHTVSDLYRPFFGISVPGAVFPVVTFLFIGIYGKVIWLMISAVIFGIGHIGIHLQNMKSLDKKVEMTSHGT